MHQVLQWLGGGFFLLNKIFLSFSERARNRGDENRARKWRIASWAVYLVGLTPWIIIFVSWHNWIAASVEASGAPAMLLGLVTAYRGTTKNPPRWLNRLALFLIPFGFVISYRDFGGITTLNQGLEIGLVLGYSVGTYLLARERAGGYLWYILMNVSCGWLMWIQGYPLLFFQQMISLIFIIDAYCSVRKRCKSG